VWYTYTIAYFCLSLLIDLVTLALLLHLISSDGGNVVYPTVVAVHPWKPYQIAVGMSDGAVHVLEPLWDTDVEVGSKTASGERPLGDTSSTSSSGQPSQPDV
jgi:hypothetical protein